MSQDNKKISPFLCYLYEYYKDKTYGEILFSYEGEINHQNILSFTQLTEKKFELFQEKSFVRKKVFNILVEVLQNIYNHGLSENKTKLRWGRGSIVLIREDRYYKIISGNLIDNKYVESMTQIINKLNNLNIKDLREHYKDILTNGRFSNKGGAGLGFIDMARKSENKIGCEFVKLDKDFSFFIVEIKINH